MNDLVSRQAAIDAIYHHLPSVSRTRARTMLHEVPSAQPEPLTAIEQRIFLAAMGRELDICKEMDKEFPTIEVYEDTWESVCREITRKVKGALWT